MSRAHLAARLQAFITSEIPLTRAMQASVEQWDGRCLTLSAPLVPNINHRGTAFGGGLYSLAVLAAWGLLRMRLWQAGHENDLVLRRAEAEYRKPVASRLTARCCLEDEEAWACFLDEIGEGLRARMDLFAQVGDPADPQMTLRARFVALGSDQVVPGAGSSV